MDIKAVRQVSSVGCRLPDRSRAATRSAGSSMAAADSACNNRGVADSANAVQQDMLWTEVVCKERRAVREWEKKWDFLWKCDFMGRPREEEPLPSTTDVKFFSEKYTTNQIFSSRLSTPLGRELARLERSLLWPGSFQHKHKTSLHTRTLTD
ncbi:uncharacterized protein C2orf50 homolog [Nematolebias whitei]|uniref:uncharacterized protein C2orf50 homolog n=1 Tax=Nematolebias whitei TaxID=451745 RepID=UPI00189A56F2|nr:uncharacterized protein C2orf50 homolog [Nematolebias whitei]